jgi:MFS family permease
MDLGPQGGLDWNRLFRQKGFPFLFVAMFVSLFGTGMNFAGVTWYVLEQTGSAKATALITVLVTLPGLFVPPFGGVLIDRVDRRYLGITLDLARAGVVLATAALISLGHGDVWHIYLMVLLLGVGFSIYWNTTHALLQEVTGGQFLVSANSAVLIAVQGGMMSAGAVVGFLYERIHLAGILTIDGITYLVSAFCLLNLRHGYHPPHGHEESSVVVVGEAGAESARATDGELILPLADEIEPLPGAKPGLVIGFLRDLREGFRYLRSQPRVLSLGLTYACMMAGVLSSNVLLAALSKDVLRAGAKGFGFMEAGWALGAVVGGLTVNLLVQRYLPRVILLAALTTLAVGHALFPYVQILAIAVAMHALFGMCRAYGGVLTQSSIMNTVPRRLMGRTQSSFSIIATVLQVIMSFTLGALADHVGLPVAFGVLGMLYGISALSAYHLKRLPADTGGP